MHLLREEESKLILIFCSTRRNVDFIADNLEMLGINAKAIHGGLDQKKRLRVLDEFKKKGEGILVCTDVAARGLPIEQVDIIICYDVAYKIESHIHRMGRTGRNDQTGYVLTIITPKEMQRFDDICDAYDLDVQLVDHQFKPMDE